jgi:hypothetical protein
MTAPTQLVISVVLSIVLALAIRDDAGEWADVIGIVLGMSLGPSLGAGLMTFLVRRARAKSTVRALLTGACVAVSTFTATGALLNFDIHPFATLGLVVALSTAVVWILAGRGGR